MKKSIFTLFISVISIATFAINMVSTETKPFKLSIDHDSVRAYNGPETLTYSPFWSEEEGETAEITQNSETFLSKQTHEGDVVWQTSQDGVHYFEHKIRNASGEIIETETAAFAKNVGTEFYTVRFNANQGNGNMPNQIFALNEAKTLSKNTFTREGYKFVGWRKSPEYLVIDLSGGTSAASYPMTILSEVPAGGWTDEYKTTKLVLRKITAGKMPCKDVDVTLTKDYYVGVFEVTQKQWELVMGSNPSYFDGDTLPVETVSYDDIRGTSNGSQWPASNAVDATSFMGKLRAKTGIDFDLPTEAQWEYACRAGSSGDYGLLADGTIGAIDQMGWYDENSGGITHIVGAKTPNAWGLYDMHGNVWEWCLDWCTSNFLNSGVDPVGPNTGKYRRLCGASHYDFKNMTSLTLMGISGSHWPYLKEKNDGLRVVAPTTFLSSIDDLSSEFLLDEQVVSNLSYVDGGIVDLYAVWEETYYYNVRFNANGGEGQMETQQFEKGEAKALSKNTFTREGYKFVGWGGIKSEYLVVDLSGGTSATSYPVTTLPDVPDGGWTDEYKTTKLVLRKITAGKMPRTDVDITLTKDYYVGVFEVTQEQWELVMGSNPSYFDGDTLPVEKVSYNDIRGSSNGSKWPASNAVDATSFMG
ncbi:MAG: SUMF1/EgtB/PvdO family nonheme iron enzyme, partial [Kiritimatiellae bacterium]|nr:SUMF1/EgtB/PvdO family nonheme iron enzyme [Kiritimatiellia bacterium]